MKKLSVSLLSRVFLGLIVALLALTVAIVPAHAQAVTAKHVSSTSQVKPHGVTAPPPCYGVSCYGKDPYSTGCGHNGQPQGNVVNAWPADIPANNEDGLGSDPVGTIYNYFSTWCDANWEQVLMYSYSQIPSPTHTLGVAITIKTTDSNNHFEQQCEPACSASPLYTGSSGYPAWTNMVDGSNITYACTYTPQTGSGSWPGPCLVPR